MAPKLSVIIPTHNRRAVLARCIAALAAQGQDPSTFEVVIADDGSEDGTAEMLAELRTPFALRALNLGKVGSMAARNAAIEASEGEITLVMDDDVIAGRGLIEAHLAAHREQGMVVAIGRLDQAAPRRRDWYARAFAEGWNSHFDRLAEKEADWTDCYSGNMSALARIAACGRRLRPEGDRRRRRAQLPPGRGGLRRSLPPRRARGPRGPEVAPASDRRLPQAGGRPGKNR